MVDCSSIGMLANIIGSPKPRNNTSSGTAHKAGIRAVQAFALGGVVAASRVRCSRAVEIDRADIAVQPTFGKGGVVSLWPNRIGRWTNGIEGTAKVRPAFRHQA